jgi:hypothetical protein
MDRERSGDRVAEDAWRLYESTREWVRHADAKATALMTADATVAAGLLTLDKLSGLSSVWLCIALVLAVASFGFSMWAMVPHLRSGSGESLIFFDHAAKRHKEVGTYILAHQQLLASNEKLCSDLADQTWNLARIARNKFLWTGFSLLGFFGAGVVAAGLLLWEVNA